MTDKTPNFTVELDIHITRRLRAHFVVDAAGEQVYVANRFSDILSWLVDVDCREVIVIDDATRFRLAFEPLPPEPTQEKG